ncbi:MAG TPA: CDP-alcohol phosphatidyltransferase family protein [Desulfobacteraceae bacterium]|nr:CDP-alcohol phosphatidyltransferase family protein [Desulfobacteraceae bacterium]
MKKTTDGPVSRYINRPVSLRITRYLINTPLTPNQLSFLSFLTAVVAGGVFALKGYAALVIGAVLAQFSSILDGCDGEVARLKSQTSEFGGWFDAVLDRYADAFVLLGLTIHVLWEGPTLGAVLAGYFSVSGSLINSYTAHKYDSYLRDKLGNRAVTFRLGRDVRIFLIFLGALLNRVLATLVVLAVITNLENIRRIWVLYREWSGKKE